MPYTLQFLHMSDGEGSTLTPTTAPIMGALIQQFRTQYANTLTLAGGDNLIPGPFVTAGADPSLNAIVGTTALGRPDIAIYNAFGVQASALGNHEWDLGSSVLRDAFSASGTNSTAFPGAQFPYLAADLDFSQDSFIAPVVVAGGQEASTIRGRVAPSTVVTVNGQRIGIVGATTQVLERISSPSGTEVDGFPKAGQPGDNLVERDDMGLLASQLQPVIDALRASGIDKIVVDSHLQLLSNEQALAPLLRGVDIILAAGSHTRLGDATDVAAAFPGHDASFQGGYPIQTRDADGNPVFIVATDSESTYLGRLVVTFDDNGVIIPSSLDPAVSGAYASTQASLQAAYGANISQAFAPGSIGARVQQITGAVNAVIQTKESNLYGFSSVYLEGDRVFGRSEETNLGDVSADANAFVARAALPTQPFVASLKNGGGIRASVGSISDGSNNSAAGIKLPTAAVPSAGKAAGAISQLDIENALRFDNKLMVFDTTPQGLYNILNYGAGLAPGNGGFPQIGGVKFSYDPTKPAGSRVQDIALVNEAGAVIAKIADDGVVLAGAPPTISVVTLNFTANGGDGYPVKQNATNFRYLLTDGTLSAPLNPALDFTLPANTPGNVVGEQAAFQSYFKAQFGTADKAYGTADTPAAQDLRIENLALRSDAVFDSAPVTGSRGIDTIESTPGNDRVNGGAGGSVDTFVFHARLIDYGIEAPGAFDIVSGPEGRDTVFGFERVVFTDTTVVLNDGAPLVDDLYYDLRYKDVFLAGQDPDAHYAAFGAREGRDPNALFSTNGYLSANPTVRSSGANPVADYDATGWKTGRDPSIKFDNELYLSKNPDVRTAGLDPLAHYLQYGQSEGRQIDAAIGQRADIAANGFDREYYLLANPDVGAAGVDAAAHYLRNGAAEGRDPNAFFDSSAYLARYADVARAGLNPLDHYHVYGWHEGRDPGPNFDTKAYLAAYPDVAQAGIDPLTHYLQYGALEGRTAFDDGILA